MKAISKLKHEEMIKALKVIPKSSEKYLALILNHKIILLDSFAFTGASLAKLSQTLLKSGKEKFKAVHQIFETKHADMLLRGKGKLILSTK